MDWNKLKELIGGAIGGAGQGTSGLLNNLLQNSHQPQQQTQKVDPLYIAPLNVSSVASSPPFSMYAVGDPRGQQFRDNADTVERNRGAMINDVGGINYPGTNHFELESPYRRNTGQGEDHINVYKNPTNFYQRPPGSWPY